MDSLAWHRRRGVTLRSFGLMDGGMCEWRFTIHMHYGERVTGRLSCIMTMHPGIAVEWQSAVFETTVI